MNKEEFKNYIKETLLLEPWKIQELVDGKSNYKEEQEIWNSLKQESKDLIESYAIAFYHHIDAGCIFSCIFKEINNYGLKYNDNNDYVDDKGNIKFTSYDYLNVNFVSIVNTIVEYEFMND